MSGQGSRDAYADLVSFTTQISDPSARASPTAAPEDRGASRRLQAPLNRHGALGVHWREFSNRTSLKQGAGLARQQGHDTVS